MILSSMIEVFKTNVQKQKQAKLLAALSEAFPHYRISFDLDDCDRILRVEGEDICNQQIIQLLGVHACFCEVLE